eukprot:TRINITY_DN2966_c0_g1_i12.p3 TRINITY_DN2966_c0_g1~~TRINITY_DN2966_c0_g1_i12.p3  ORF type:complete len:141 (-),score=37.80 TRINITY_DN2966_c0_g1_i12:40-462(-)
MCIRDRGTTSDNDWQEQIKEKANELDIKCCFDAVAGEQAGLILQNMPKSSTLYVYGRLSGQPCSQITAYDLIFLKKKVEGLWLEDYLQNKDQQAKEAMFQELRRCFSKFLAATICQEYSFDDIKLALYCLLYTSPSPRDS